MPICQIDGMIPVAPAESYVHPTAVLIGGVIPSKGIYVGPSASLRGGFGRIVAKDGANIQDNCVMYEFPDQGTVAEEDEHTGHGTILHDCVIGWNALAGMSAAVIDDATIGGSSIVGASVFVKARAEIPANHPVVGNPAKTVRMLIERELVQKRQGTREYRVLVERRQQTPAEVGPLTAVEPDRKRSEFDENLQPKPASQRFYATPGVRTDSWR